MKDGHLTVASTGRVTTLRWHRPQARNAMSSPLAAEIRASLVDLGEDTSVVVLHPEGDTFCAGWDVAEFSELDGSSDEHVERFLADNLGLLDALEDTPAVTIAVVAGPALGFGAALAARCDLVIAADDAVFGFPEVALGIPPALAMYEALAVMPRRSVLAWSVDGASRSASEASDAGLVHQVVPAKHLEDRARRDAAAIGRHHPQAVRETKRLAGVLARLERGDAAREAVRAGAAALRSDVAREGVAAFTTGRPPSWSPSTEAHA